MGYRVDEPKTESGRRYIYMTDEVMAAFEHVMASRPKAKPLSVDGRTGFIFLNRDGLPRVGGDYDRVFRGLRGKYAKRGKMELPDGMTPHTLRHTFCTEMAKAGHKTASPQPIRRISSQTLLGPDGKLSRPLSGSAGSCEMISRVIK